MIGFNNRSSEDAYREQTNRITSSAPGLLSYSWACKSCGTRMYRGAKKKQVVPGAPKYGFLCLDCHAKRGEK